MFLRDGLGDWPAGSPSHDWPNGAQVGDTWIDGPVRIYNYHKGSGGWWGEVYQPHGRIGLLRPGGKSGRFLTTDATVPIWSAAQIREYLNPPPPVSPPVTTPTPPPIIANPTPTAPPPSTPPPQQTQQITTQQLAAQIAAQIAAMTPAPTTPTPTTPAPTTPTPTTPAPTTSTPPPIFEPSGGGGTVAPTTPLAPITDTPAPAILPAPVTASILPSGSNPWMIVIGVGVAVSLFLGSAKSSRG